MTSVKAGTFNGSCVNGVLFNGVLLKNVVEADESENWIKFAPTSLNGELFYPTQFGTVQLDWKIGHGPGSSCEYCKGVGYE